MASPAKEQEVDTKIEAKTVSKKTMKKSRKIGVEQALMDAWKDKRQAEEQKDVNIVKNVMSKAENKKGKSAKLARQDSKPIDLQAVLSDRAETNIGLGLSTRKKSGKEPIGRKSNQVKVPTKLEKAMTSMTAGLNEAGSNPNSALQTPGGKSGDLMSSNLQSPDSKSGSKKRPFQSEVVSTDQLLGLVQNTILGSPDSSKNPSPNDSFRQDIEDLEEETKEKRKSKSSTRTLNAIQTDLEALSFSTPSNPATSGANKEAYLRLGSKEIYSEVKDVIKEEDDEMIEEELSRADARASRTSKAGSGHNFDKITKPVPAGMSRYKSDQNQQSVKFQKKKALTMEDQISKSITVGEVNQQLTK